ncbi:MAG: response regulator [Spirulina sp. DLM2.Bin59]|nr:MAG: response regulator [Spirulina sp. DLM2.Bin59]
MRLLLVEDDEILLQTLNEALLNQGYVVNVARDGEEGWDYANSFTYDLMLLDVSLPKLDGINLCRRLRQAQINTPILLLTANDASEAKVTGLDAGADDYVVKPCTIPELLARIRALLRRQSDSSAPILTWGLLQLNPSACEVRWDQEILNLSPKEYNLLELFLRHPRQVFTKGAILEHLWSFDDPPGEETVRAHIKGLRRKLKAVGADGAIETVYGMGYCLKAVEMVEPTPSETPKAKAMQSGMEKLWEQFREPILARLDQIEGAIAAAQGGNLPDRLRWEAAQEAHKLVGSLGMFGLPEGSDLARQLELGLGQPLTVAQGDQLRQVLTDLQGLLPAPAAPKPVTPPLHPFSRGISPSLSTDYAPRLLIIDPDLSQGAALATEAQLWPVVLECCGDWEEAMAQVKQWRDPPEGLNPPDVVIVELAFPQGPTAGLKLLKQLRDLPKPPLLLVLTAENNFGDRVAVARLGVQGFLMKPITAAELLTTVFHHLQQQRPPEARVLAVDDDPVLLRAMASFLAPWPIELQTLEDPRQFWATLQRTAPDLLILDVEMPHINGLELCQVVRNDPNWAQLPIVFLSANCDREMLQRIYQIGADDYISKPVSEPELVTRLFNRLERSRLLRDLAEKDPLTGVANRYRAEQDFQRFFDLAQQERQKICLIVLKVRDLENINRDYGHDLGDRILQRFGQLLQKTCSREDVVSRWSGGEFIIGMYGLKRREGEKVIRDMIALLAEEIFLLEGQLALAIRMEGSLAVYPEDGKTLTQLYQAGVRGAKKKG